MLQIIKRVHGLFENTDIEKHRQSQDYVGTIFGKSKELRYKDVNIEGVTGEWVSVNSPHIEK